MCAMIKNIKNTSEKPKKKKDPEEKSGKISMKKKSHVGKMMNKKEKFETCILSASQLV
jgi:hypothetical protein